MPGFRVVNPDGGEVGDPRGPSSRIVAYYTYTWNLTNMFGENTNGSMVYAKSAVLPRFTAKQDTVQGAALVYKYADTVVWEDARITFYDIPAAGGTIASKLRLWRDRVWSVAYGIGQAERVSPNDQAGYKRPTTIWVHPNIGPSQDSLAPSMGWQMNGSWPSSINNGELSYTESEVKIVEVVITYDYAVEVFE